MAIYYLSCRKQAAVPRKRHILKSQFSLSWCACIGYRPALLFFLSLYNLYDGFSFTSQETLLPIMFAILLGTLDKTWEKGLFSSLDLEYSWTLTSAKYFGTF